MWEGCWVEKMVRTGVQHVRAGGGREPKVWDVCAWGFGCFRGTVVGRFQEVSGSSGWLRRWTGGNLECLANLCGCVIVGVV